jgi:hypothetical protein
MFFVYGRRLSVVYSHGSWGYCRYGVQGAKFKYLEWAESIAELHSKHGIKPKLISDRNYADSCGV